MNFNEINYNMSVALDMAEKARQFNEVPVGAVLVGADGALLAKKYNTKEYDANACHHAELLAISEASQKLSSWRLIDCSLFVTLEPCVMCMGAIIHARLKNVYFGAYDPKGGAISLGFNIHRNGKLNHQIGVYGGFKHRDCAKVLSDFFRAKRSQYKARR